MLGASLAQADAISASSSIWCAASVGANVTNVLVSDCTALSDNCTVQALPATGLPLLPDENVRMAYEVAAECQFDDVVRIGGVISLAPDDRFFRASREMRRSMQLFADVVNNERGGLRVGGARHAIHLQWISDGSSVLEVANATAYASRTNGGAHFLVGPFGSALTQYAALQAEADGKILMAPAAATPNVVAASNRTFSIMPPANEHVAATLRGVLAAARECDAQTQSYSASSASNLTKRCAPTQRARRCALGGGSCVASLRAGFIHERTAFPTATCGLGQPAMLTSLGLSYATDGTGQPLTASFAPLDVDAAMLTTLTTEVNVSSTVYDAFVHTLITALTPLRDANVTVLLGCTDSLVTGRALVDALYSLRYEPLAVMLSASVVDPRFGDLVYAGWWRGE
jgi:hypothetical protein